jgi:hypothetical protein
MEIFGIHPVPSSHRISLLRWSKKIASHKKGFSASSIGLKLRMMNAIACDSVCNVYKHPDCLSHIREVRDLVQRETESF